MTDDERQALLILIREHARTATRDTRKLLLELAHTIDAAPAAMQARVNEAYRREAVETAR